MLAGVVVTEGIVAACADDVAKHCVLSACPAAVDLGGGALFVPTLDLPACRSAVDDLLARGIQRDAQSAAPQRQ
jgi:hypothetical protein